MSRFLTINERLEIIRLSRNASASETARVFNQLHPERVQQLNKSTVIRILAKLNETGSVCDKVRTGRRSILHNHQEVQNIVDLFIEDPHTSIRSAAGQTGHSTRTVHKVLKSRKFHPYKQQRHQRLLEIDYPRRLDFCRAFSERSLADRSFCRKILWTDESMVFVNGTANKQNFRLANESVLKLSGHRLFFCFFCRVTACYIQFINLCFFFYTTNKLSILLTKNYIHFFRYWCDVNPHWMTDSNEVRGEKIMIWMGIIDQHIVGPYFIEGYVNAQSYISMLGDFVMPILDSLELNIDFNEIWYQHDGASAHTAYATQDWLHENFDNWIGRGGTINLPDSFSRP